MKKFILVLVVLLAAAPAMAVVTITATPDGTTGNVDLVVTWSGEGTPPRAFALDVNVTSDVNIIDVSGYHTGESKGAPGNKGFGIFPASFNREIDADDPNWADVNYTPVADACDLPGDTLGGIGTSGVTLELGSLYTGPNVPTSPTTLATVTVDGSCTMCFSRNVGRGKVVLEDGNEPASFSAPCVAVTVEELCTVPDVVDDTNAVAQAAIIAAGFTVGNITAECNDVIAAGNVISTNPAAGATPACDTAVDMVVSTGPCVACSCCGDLSGDGYVRFADVGDLAGLLNTFGVPTPAPFGPISIAPTDVAHWDPCADVDDNGLMQFADVGAISGWLNTYGVPIPAPFGPISIQCPHAYGSCP